MITRYESNKEILNIVSEFVENNKDIRFVQALYTWYYRRKRRNNI